MVYNNDKRRHDNDQRTCCTLPKTRGGDHRMGPCNASSRGTGPKGGGDTANSKEPGDKEAGDTQRENQRHGDQKVGDRPCQQQAEG